MDKRIKIKDEVPLYRAEEDVNKDDLGLNYRDEHDWNRFTEKFTSIGTIKYSFKEQEKLLGDLIVISLDTHLLNRWRDEHGKVEETINLVNDQILIEDEEIDRLKEKINKLYDSKKSLKAQFESSQTKMAHLVNYYASSIS
jgi:uncharacterized coiled-coil protein SlyX